MSNGDGRHASTYKACHRADPLHDCALFPFLIWTLDFLWDPTGLSVKGLLPVLRPKLLFECTSAGRNLSLWSFFGGESQGSQLKLAPVEDHVFNSSV